MSEQPHEVGHGDHDAMFKTYIGVFFALCVFTAVSFVANWAVSQGYISAATSVTIIMAVAVVKATLVCMIFMHLKYDWSKLYCIIVPVSILCVMMMIILCIDQVLAWHIIPDRP
jgi:caa(3)-type oxidase subunit IV